MSRLPLDKRGIPARVLQGKVSKYKSVSLLYKAHLSQEVMRRVNRSFWARAKGGTDDLGNRWKELKPVTHAYKPLSPTERRAYRLGTNLSRGLLTPSQDKLWRRIYARNLARLEKRGVADAEKKAAEKAWGILKSMGAKTLKGLGRITDINIRTGRLVAATRPGTVSNNRYYSPRDQEVRITSRGISISLRRIPYAASVDRVRPIIPEDISKWVAQAHSIAISVARSEYVRIKNSSESRRGLPKGTRPRRNP